MSPNVKLIYTETPCFGPGENKKAQTKNRSYYITNRASLGCFCGNHGNILARQQTMRTFNILLPGTLFPSPKRHSSLRRSNRANSSADATSISKVSPAAGKTRQISLNT